MSGTFYKLLKGKPTERSAPATETGDARRQMPTTITSKPSRCRGPRLYAAYALTDSSSTKLPGSDRLSYALLRSLGRKVTSTAGLGVHSDPAGTTTSAFGVGKATLPEIILKVDVGIADRAVYQGHAQGVREVARTGK